MPYLPPTIVGLQVFGFQNSISPYGWCSFWRFSATWERSLGPRPIYNTKKTWLPIKATFLWYATRWGVDRNVLLNSSYMIKDVAKCWTTLGQRNVGGERRLFDNMFFFWIFKTIKRERQPGNKTRISFNFSGESNFTVHKAVNNNRENDKINK